MPELPEVETVKRVLESWIIGKKVANVRVRYAPIFDNATEDEVRKTCQKSKNGVDYFCFL